jgi:hypothetical protein
VGVFLFSFLLTLTGERCIVASKIKQGGFNMKTAVIEKCGSGSMYVTVHPNRAKAVRYAGNLAMQNTSVRGGTPYPESNGSAGGGK